MRYTGITMNQHAFEKNTEAESPEESLAKVGREIAKLENEIQIIRSRKSMNPAMEAAQQSLIAEMMAKKAEFVIEEMRLTNELKKTAPSPETFPSKGINDMYNNDTMSTTDRLRRNQ